MKIYTKTGDQGDTSLFGGGRVSKNAPRIEAYGTVDELNSILGWALSQSPDPHIEETLSDLQQELFVLGADLATPIGSKASVTRIQSEDFERLEQLIDRFDENLPSLKNFILPGGSSCGAALHLARTVCRRAERAVVACLQTDEEINKNTIVYLNRLSDLLFVLARYQNHWADQKETTWKPDPS